MCAKEKQPERLEELHKRGQEDGSKGEYDPPRGPLFFILEKEEVKELFRAENRAYDAGYENARKSLE